MGFIPESIVRVIALDDVKRQVRADVIRHRLDVEFAEGDWQLPPSDESKVGLD